MHKNIKGRINNVDQAIRGCRMEDIKGDKIVRVLDIYTKLINGGVINKLQEADRYGVNERTIQRDIDDIRNFLELDVSACKTY